MKQVFPLRLELARISNAKSSTIDYHNSSYMLRGPQQRSIIVELSDKGGWDHIQIRPMNRGDPDISIQEIEFVCRLVLQDEEAVVGVYGKRPIEYINLDHNTHHLWRKHSGEMEMPPVELW